MAWTLPYIVLGATAVSLVGQILVLRRTRVFAKRTVYATSAGNTTAGIRYAFLEGMMPWEKESASKHLITYIGGVLYHLGISAALVSLYLSVFQFQMDGPIPLALTSLAALGLLAGIGLLLKRISISYLRSISKPDDFLSNLLVDLFLALSVLAAFQPVVLPLLYTEASLLLLYMPLGKIRHCCLFFVSRVTFGRYFGRRGVVPHPKPQVRV